jgi:hypothetical protein
VRFEQQGDDFDRDRGAQRDRRSPDAKFGFLVRRFGTDDHDQ